MSKKVNKIVSQNLGISPDAQIEEEVFEEEEEVEGENGEEAKDDIKVAVESNSDEPLEFEINVNDENKNTEL